LASYDGEKWTSFNVLDHVDKDISFNYVRNVTVDPNDPDIIYAGMFASGGSVVLRTLDGGSTWQDISNNLSRMGGALKVNPHTGELYRGSMFGTWIFPAPYDEVPVPNSDENKFGLKIAPDSVKLPPGATKLLNIGFTLSCLADLPVVWESGDTTMAKVSASGEVTAITEGSCTITATTENDNFAAVCHVIIDPNFTGIRSVQKSTFKAFTDSENQLSIIFPGRIELCEVTLYNQLGAKVLNQSFKNNVFVHRKDIDISGIPQGFYIVEVFTGDGYATQKIVKK
jgi:hypothetical protein